MLCSFVTDFVAAPLVLEHLSVCQH